MGPVIYLYGPSGAGTTTLGRTLAAELGWRHMDTDDYFWKPTDPPYTVKRPIERRLELMEKELDREAVGTVLSGALDGWGDPLIPRFSLAVRLEVEQSVRLERLRARELAAFGERILPGGDMHENHREFMEWAARYDTAGPEQRSLARQKTWETGLPCPRLVLDGAAGLEEASRKMARLQPQGWKRMWPESGKSGKSRNK